MKYGSLLLALLFIGSTSWAAEPRLEWTYTTGGKIYASPLIADLDGDGSQEIIVCASRDHRVLCLDGEGEVIWDYRLETAQADGVMAAPSIVDYDGDGMKEVFFLTKGGVAGCLDARGKLIWRTATGDVIDYTGPVVADINSDGRVEVVFGSDSGTLYCLDDAGMELWHYQGDGEIRGIPALAFHPESGTYRIYTVFADGMSACFSSTGDLLWSHMEPAPRNERRSGAAVADLNGDGTPEVILANEEYEVIVRNAFSGDEVWRFKGELKIDQTSSFALADFGEGLEIICGDGIGLGGPGNVYRLRNGEAVWTHDTDGGVVQGPSVGDVDGDGELEILVCLRSNKLICLSASGEQEWQYKTEAGPLCTPALGDVDGDGEVEIIFAAKDKRIYCLSVGGKLTPDLLPWPNINHDLQLTGNWNGAPFTPAPANLDTTDDAALEIVDFGLLRTGGNTVAFRFGNKSHRPARLEAVAAVTTPEDRQITHQVLEELAPGEFRSVDLEISALDEGDYRLDVQLMDEGAGRLLASTSKIQSLEPLAVESVKAQDLLARGRAILEAFGPGDAHDRAEAALSEQERAFNDTLQLSEPVFKSDSSTRGKRGAAQRVSDSLDNLERDIARLNAAAATPGEHAQFAAVPASTLVKVFQDEPFLVTPGDAAPARISLAKNETEGVQVVVVPLWENLEGLTVRVSDLIQADGEGAIPASAVEVHRVGYVQPGPPEYNFRVEKEGLYPDILFDATPIDVPASQDAQPYYIWVSAPADAAPGDYEGTIHVLTADGAPLELPLQVHVWDFALPPERHLKTSFWMNEGQIKSFYNFEGRVPDEVVKRYYDLHLKYLVSPVMAFPLNGDKMLDDFEYLMANGQNCLFVNVPHALSAIDEAAFAADLRGTRDLLVEKGWSDDTYFYTRDEVAVMARHEIPDVVKINNWVNEIIPEWPRLQTSAPEQSLFGAVDIWCPTIDHFDPVVLEKRMAQGDRLWFYTVWGRPGIMIEFPATDHRVMFWECWKYGAEGFLYWGTTHWSLNMASPERWPQVPWIPWNSQPGHNGCGYLIYPGAEATPLPSIRLAIVRDGIEDYEYFWLLNELAKQKSDAMSEALREKVSSALAVSPAVVVSNEEFTDEPGNLIDARAELAALIEELSQLK